MYGTYTGNCKGMSLLISPTLKRHVGGALNRIGLWVERLLVLLALLLHRHSGLGHRWAMGSAKITRFLV